MKKATLILVCCAFALRVLVPAGYMPGALDSGWFLQICPEGLNAHERTVLFASADSQAGHQHHQHHEASYLDCDLGGASAEDFPPAPQAFLSDPAPDVTGLTSTVRPAYERYWTSRFARAPPNSDRDIRHYV